MKGTFLKIIGVLFVVVLMTGLSCFNLYAEIESKQLLLSGRVVYVDQDLGFIVCNLGREDGLSEDCFLRVSRRNTTIGEVRVVKVRRRFCAAQIELTYENQAVKIGDTVKVSKKSAIIIKQEAKKALLDKLERLFQEAEEYFKDGRYKQAQEKVEQALDLDPENKQALDILEDLQKAARGQEIDQLFDQVQAHLQELDYELANDKVALILQLDPRNQQARDIQRKIKQSLQIVNDLKPEIIVVDISAPKQVIHSFVIDVFEKYGYLITFADPLKYNLRAYKITDLGSFAGEWGPFTRNKIYYSVEIEDAPMSELLVNRLVICVRGTYDSEGTIRNYSIKKGSSAYKEAYEMALAIKTLAEEL